MRKERTKTSVEYVAVALVDHIDVYGDKVVKKGEKTILKRPNIEKYKDTGKAYFVKKNPYYGSANYFIPVKLTKVTTKVTTITDTIEEEV